MEESRIELNKGAFCEAALNHIHRSGVSDLLRALGETDFFTAPCSTRYHLSEPGGLVQHSLNVFDRAWSLNQILGLGYSVESVALVSLFHDICKANTYKLEKRWRKVDGQWEQYDTYQYDELFTYGHGEKSTFMLMRYIRDITDEECQAVRYHMGAWMDGEKQGAGNAFSKNKLAVLLHMADMMATYFDEA